MASKDFATLINQRPITLGATIIDMQAQGAEGLTFIFEQAANSVVTIEDDDVVGFGSATVVPAQFLIGDTTFSGAGSASLGYVGKKQFIRMSMTNPVANTSVFIILAPLLKAPGPSEGA